MLTQVSIQRLKDLPPHTSIVVKKIEAAWAACCTPSKDAPCAMLRRTLETTMPLFTAQARFKSFEVLGLFFGLLGLITGFLITFSLDIKDGGVEERYILDVKHYILAVLSHGT